jgi:hypothetical protein
MKCYTKQFLKKLGKNLNINDEEFMVKLRETENEYRRKLPDNFDYLTLVGLACEEFKITTDEYFSKYRYGQLGKVRQSVCFIMKVLGAKLVQISKLTGYTSSYISNSIRLISDDVDALKKIELIIKYLNDENDD